MATQHEIDLLGTTDVVQWAEEFMRLFGDRREEIDTDLMMAWFANAMQAKAIQARQQQPDRSAIAELLYMRFVPKKFPLGRWEEMTSKERRPFEDAAASILTAYATQQSEGSNHASE